MPAIVMPGGPRSYPPVHSGCSQSRPFPALVSGGRWRRSGGPASTGTSGSPCGCCPSWSRPPSALEICAWPTMHWTGWLDGHRPGEPSSGWGSRRAHGRC